MWLVSPTIPMLGGTYLVRHRPTWVFPPERRRIYVGLGEYPKGRGDEQISILAARSHSYPTRIIREG